MKTLKELFRYQNVLKGIFEETRVRLGDRRIFTETKETHKYSGRNEKKKDETVLADEDYKKSNPTANELIACLIAVSQEREKVSLAIAKAKKEMEFAMDAQMELNHVRQDVASVLSKLNRVPASVSETKQGRDFVFNEEGNQVHISMIFRQSQPLILIERKYRNSCRNIRENPMTFQWKLNGSN